MLGHDELAQSLAAHLRGDARMIWCDLQLGPSGSPRPDVYTIDKFVRPESNGLRMERLAPLRLELCDILGRASVRHQSQGSRIAQFSEATSRTRGAALLHELCSSCTESARIQGIRNRRLIAARVPLEILRSHHLPKSCQSAQVHSVRTYPQLAEQTAVAGKA